MTQQKNKDAPIITFKTATGENVASLLVINWLSDKLVIIFFFFCQVIKWKIRNFLLMCFDLYLPSFNALGRGQL